ncbi:MAG: glycosyltransferase family 2 protein [Candidatus Tenebribacter burtonii]|jgi:glycosyltransferase involved in cell wall biosynthesis|nr:glycosyltransferase family 2 protein [Candidatus Tenebribacter burtonii]
MPSKVLIIIPAYNEAHIIKEVIWDLHSENTNWNLLVVNDGSNDKTKEIAESTGLAKVINLPCQVGIGSCVQTGFKYASKHDFDFAVQFDGDGQHKVYEIEKLLHPLETNEADVVIGSRFCVKNPQYKPSFLRAIGIKVFELVNSILIGQRITDNTSGFRAYNKKTISFLSENYSSDYPEPEAVILLGKNRFKIKEIHTEMDQRSGGKSSIYGIYSGYYMVKVLLSILLTFIRPKIVNSKPT